MPKRKLIAESDAPLKVIISGEHSVVYNAPGITMALTPRNKVSLYEEPGKAGLVIKSDRGQVTLSPEGKIVGKVNKEFAPFVGMVRYLMQQGFHPKARLVAEISVSGAPKGMGTSASISAALASSLYYAMGKKPKRGHNATRNELWKAVQMAEEVAHGGRPSGIDAMSVVSGATKLTRVLKGGQINWRFEKQPISLPRGASLIIVDTFDGKRSTTGEMIRLFARRYGLLKAGAVKTLHDLTQADKAKLAAFQRAFDKIVVQLTPDGNPVKLGNAIGRNQALLAKGGVSTRRIETAIRLAKKHGAHGAKLTGAGGHGGAVIVVADKSRAQGIEQALEGKGFKTFPARSTGAGTRLTFKGKLRKRHRK